VLESSRVKEKTGEEKTKCDPARPGQKLGCNPLTLGFFFYQNNVVLIFFKIDPGDLVTRSKPGTRA
jgi:hypothetical protein